MTTDFATKCNPNILEIVSSDPLRQRYVSSGSVGELGTGVIVDGEVWYSSRLRLQSSNMARDFNVKRKAPKSLTERLVLAEKE